VKLRLATPLTVSGRVIVETIEGAPTPSAPSVLLIKQHGGQILYSEQAIFTAQAEEDGRILLPTCSNRRTPPLAYCRHRSPRPAGPATCPAAQATRVRSRIFRSRRGRYLRGSYSGRFRISAVRPGEWAEVCRCGVATGGHSRKRPRRRNHADGSVPLHAR